MLKVGLVGVGGWGKNHARVLSELGVLAAICDKDLSRAMSFSKLYGVPAYGSVEDMIRSQQLHIADVCTPTTTHRQVAGILLESGIHVFIEKPLASTVQEGREIAELAKRKGLTVGVGYIERFNPAVAQLKKLVTEGSLGELLVAEFYRENRWSGVKDVGIIKDTSVHDIDTARHIFEEEPLQVFCRTGRILGPYEDFAVMMLGFKGHRTAILLTNWVTPKRERRLSAIFASGVVRLDFLTREVRVDTESGTESRMYESQEPLKLEISSFLRAVESGERPVVDAQDAIKTSMIAEAAVYSSSSGLPVNIQL
jgi:UDP-N-acetylglucosamine 3-dehydrogenase